MRGDITPADLAKAYPWALRAVRFDDGGLLPEIRAALEEVRGEPLRGPWLPPRSAWQPGPWMTEPDLVEWRSTAVSYPLLILRSELSILCGYVGVPPSHPLHGRPCREVFGMGVNWSGPCGGHRVPTGDPPDVWWFGFDCAHANNYVPAWEALGSWLSKETGVAMPSLRHLFGGHYVDVLECRQRTEGLAVALLEAATISSESLTRS